jgi:mercuric ion transport protein
MIRSRVRFALPAVAALFVACVVVQVFLAGLGVFESPTAFVTHRDFGYLFGWLTLVMLVLALVGGVPRRITGAIVLLLALFALQSLLVVARTDLPALAALHPLNGFAILALGGWTVRASWLARRPDHG